MNDFKAYNDIVKDIGDMEKRGDNKKAFEILHDISRLQHHFWVVYMAGRITQSEYAKLVFSLVPLYDTVLGNLKEVMD